jgi:hypothetical protein
MITSMPKRAWCTRLTRCTLSDMQVYDYRITAARNFLATAPPSDFTRLLADVVDVADDFQATDLDERVSKITTDGGIYLAPTEASRLCLSCRTLAIKVVTITGT